MHTYTRIYTYICSVIKETNPHACVTAQTSMDAAPTDKFS